MLKVQMGNSGPEIAITADDEFAKALVEYYGRLAVQYRGDVATSRRCAQIVQQLNDGSLQAESRDDY